jgi:hypothetical protein
MIYKIKKFNRNLKRKKGGEFMLGVILQVGQIQVDNQ